MNKKKLKELRDVVHKAKSDLYNMWGHWEDGSELMLDKHELFHVVFNKVINSAYGTQAKPDGLMYALEIIDKELIKRGCDLSKEGDNWHS